jgi:O-antigen ligase
MNTIRFGLYALIALAVVSFGGVESWGQAILEVGAAVLLLLWGVMAVRQQSLEIHWNWMYLPLLALGTVGLAQYGLGLSVYPYLTKVELLKWSAYIVLFFLTSESFRTTKLLKQLVWFLLGLGFVVSLFAIVQHFTFNGKLYWFVSLPAAAAPFGPFVNSNHFAGFVELVVPLGLALLLFRARRPEQVTLLLLFTIVPTAALILSGSRGGIISLLLELALLAFLSRAHQIGTKQLLSATGIVVLAGTFALWLGVSTAVEHFERLTHGGIAQELRVSLYKDTWRIFRNHPLMGTGLGTLVAVYPQYASFYDGRTVDHAHNDYLELLADTGVLGGLCGLVLIGLLLWQSLRGLQSDGVRSARAIRAGAFAACAGLLIHSLVDFNLHIPSNALIFLLLTCVATTDAGDEAIRVDGMSKAREARSRNTKSQAHLGGSDNEALSPQPVSRYESPNYRVRGLSR